MDCHVFRLLCKALVPALTGARMEKIHQPAPDVLQFGIYAQSRKQWLFLKYGRQMPFLFLARQKIATCTEPPASVMLLRKYFSGRRIQNILADWISRRLYLHYAEDEDADLWLCLDLRNGAQILHSLPEIPATMPWQMPADIAAPVQGQTWLTPALRKTLLQLPPEEQAALLVDLESGDGDLFVYEDAAGRREIFAWSLPYALRGNAEQRRSETIFAEDPLAATAFAGERCVLRDCAERAAMQRAKPFLAEASRLKRLLRKLDAEESRLTQMQAKAADALALQSQLYRFAADEKHASIVLQPLSGTDKEKTLTLNPRMTVRENMESLFHTARRGKRGLAMLDGRREAVTQEILAAEQSAMRARAGLETSRRKNPAQPGKGKASNMKLPKNVQLFRSSDGFLILRGRDAAGNAAVLKMAAPQDIWLHVGGGPGAHVIIRRDHAAQAVPEQTLREAGILAALKSWQKNGKAVEIVQASASRISPLHGGKAGEVRVTEYGEGISVDPDPHLEVKLAAAPDKK